jgi:hypothetical protein
VARMILLVLLLFLVACSPGIEAAPPESEEDPDSNLQATPSSPPTQITEPEAEEDSNPASVLPNLGPAPELTNEVWLNSDQPLRLADLRGEVVLLEMWTFG